MRMIARSPAITGCVAKAVKAAAAVKILCTKYLLPFESYRFLEPRINSIWLDKNPDKPDVFSHGVSSMGGQLYIQILGVVMTFLFALVGSLILLKLAD